MKTEWTEVSTIGDLLIRAAALAPDRCALALPDARISYAELLDGATEVARSLAGLGVAPGSKVGLFIPNGLAFGKAFFGISLLGCVVVPLNTRHKATELGFIIANGELSAILSSSEAADYVDLPAILVDALPSLASADAARPLALPEAPMLRRAILVSGPSRPGFVDAERFGAAAQGIPAAFVEQVSRRVRVRDTGLILYTSGTTANPKGCMLSHEAVTRGPVERARHRLSSGGKDVTWAAGPLFHIGSLAPFIGSVGAAGTFLSDVYFDAGRAIALMVREGVTLAWPWFSAIVQGIIDHPGFDPSDFDTLRYLFLIGPDSLVDRVQTLLPQTEVLQACGMTETAGVFALSDPDESFVSRSTTQGKAAPGVEVRIVDPETGADLPPGKMGEILVRGFCVMDGYYRDPVKTADTLTPDGWLHTGDLYSRTEGDSLIFQGRLKDMLKVGGENVATMEVEAFLCSHPDVKIAEVVGKPDPRLDEVPVAFVEIRPGSAVEPEALIAFCRGKIASYKVPRAVYFVAADDWPMSATKVDKRALRERLG